VAKIRKIAVEVKRLIIKKQGLRVMFTRVRDKKQVDGLT